MASLAHPHQVYGFGLPNGLDIPAGDFAPQSNHSPNDSHHLKRNGLSFSASLGQHHNQMMGHTGMSQGNVGIPGMPGPGQDGHIKRPMNAFMVSFLFPIRRMALVEENSFKKTMNLQTSTSV